MDRWFDGVYLIGQFNWFRTGVWLLTHGGEAALLELPPASITGIGFGPNPVDRAAIAVSELGVVVKFILCTHTHMDHFNKKTYRRMRDRFAGATAVLQSGFRDYIGEESGVRYFEDAEALYIGGEPVHLIHAPKHSQTDTMVIFRGAACTGDWELGTVRTVNERVPVETRLRSCDRMMGFAREGYHIHRTFSVHANDRRENVDFPALMAETREDHKLW
ncbi:MAG TPA: MBL fold metallo-hydrolase [Gemmata sp.]|jgi:hypothetical protein|nr:MBL fold metallo-hydrolase [Gemmata sp.]